MKSPAKTLRFLIALLSLGQWLESCATVKSDGATSQNVVTLPAGSSATLALEFEAGGAPLIGDARVVQVRRGASAREVRLMGLQRGASSISLTSADGKATRNVVVYVTPSDLLVRLESVQNLLGGIEGIVIRPVDDKILVDGQLRNPETALRDYDRILEVQDAYKDVVFNLVSLGDELYERARQRIEREIREDPGARDLHVKFLNGTYFLVGEASSQFDRDRAETIAMTFLPPFQGSPAVRENVLALGAKKYSIRNLIQVKAGPGNRLPASALAP